MFLSFLFAFWIFSLQTKIFQDATASHVTTSLPELCLENSSKKQLAELYFHFFSPALRMIFC